MCLQQTVQCLQGRHGCATLGSNRVRLMQRLLPTPMAGSNPTYKNLENQVGHPSLSAHAHLGKPIAVVSLLVILSMYTLTLCTPGAPA